MNRELAGMSGPHEPYEVEGGSQDKPAPPGGPHPAPESPDKPRLFNIPLPPPATELGKGKIEAPKLLEGFEEDADFDKDPELERVITGKTGKDDKKEGEPEAPKEDFVKPGLGNAKVWGIVGGVLLIAAMIATGVTAENSRFAGIILTLYNTLLHTGTGMVAVFVAATLLGKHFGNFELGAARMLACVAAFAFMFSLKPHLTGSQGFNSFITLAIAFAVYALMVCSTFGLWKRMPFAYVVGSHFVLWLTVQVGMLLYAAVHMTPAKPPH
jgi:hypothetical protein